ncbi:hypothetical protein DFQ28_005085 [Apophysomyces sp. BC1034]|nr:hypothetical protein DFQ30_010426 [Apophysomyces sp. BC1015]KAG0181843.1 hypothetical protein DFQ29_006769 [Apophysomyces sp. BC1021]KAG0193481.1 hypothetical protein DFQ28_005085 [Apophysomyces sp. BC1034]
MSSSKADPRRPENIVPFHLPPQQEEEDFTGNIAMYVAMAGIFLRNRFKAIPWVAAYFGLSSLLNTRKTLKSSDAIGNSGAMIAFVSMVTFYLNVYMSRKNYSSNE